MSCPYEHLDGAYVLGALSTAERLEFESHLAGCAACRQAVQELAGLPGLLAKVPADVWEDAAAPEEALPDTLRPTVVALATRHDRAHRRRRWIRAGVAAAAAVAVVVAGFAVGARWATRDEPAAEAPPTSQPTSPPTTQPTSPPTTQPTNPPTAMVPVAGESAMTAALAMSPVPWGTKLELTCSYAVAAGSHGGGYAGEPTYALVVRTRDGQEEQVATWRGLPGQTMHLAAATATPRAQIASVEVRDADGAPVLRTAT